MNRVFYGHDERMELMLAGYLPKHVAARPKSLNAPAVADVCSLNSCISAEPEHWTPPAQPNELGFFASPQLAVAAIPPDSPPMTLFAYMLLRQRYVNGVPEEYPWPRVVPIPLPAAFQSLGFDVVNHSMGEHIHFECSPLSCDGRAQQWGANSHCLIDTLDVAIRAAARFSTDGLEPVEPGDYYVAEVYRQA